MKADLKSIIIEKSRRARSAIAYACLRILTPNLLTFINGITFSKDTIPRPTTKAMQRLFGSQPLTGCEIGVGYGDNSLNLLQSLNIKRLYCVDPFVPYVDHDRKTVEYALSAKKTLEKLSKFPNVTFIRKFSSEAWHDIHEQLDFCYIDGNHEYDYVLQDLRNCYPLVRKGGIIGGHDLTLQYPSVFEALIDFCGEIGVKAKFNPPDWIIHK